VGPGRGHVRDDVRPAALLQPGPRAALRAHPHGGDPLPQEPGPRGQGPAGRPAEEGPQAEVGVCVGDNVERPSKSSLE